MTDSIAINGQMSQATSVWLWVAVIELLVILYLINQLMRRDRKKRKEVKDKLKSGHIDFENTINSAFNSKSCVIRIGLRIPLWRERPTLSFKRYRQIDIIIVS